MIGTFAEAGATAVLGVLAAADGAVLHDIVDRPLRAIPLAWARVIVAAFLASAGIWALTLKRDYVYLGAPDQARWRDLRLWAVCFLVPFIVVYLWL